MMKQQDWKQLKLNSGNKAAPKSNNKNMKHLLYIITFLSIASFVDAQHL